MAGVCSMAQHQSDSKRLLCDIMGQWEKGWYQRTSPPSVEDVLDTFLIFYVALKLG